MNHMQCFQRTLSFYESIDSSIFNLFFTIFNCIIAVCYDYFAFYRALTNWVRARVFIHLMISSIFVFTSILLATGVFSACP